MNGWPTGPPTLPPFALADGVAALAGTVATMFALWWRDHGGHGQVVDCAIYEPLFWLLGPQALVYDQLGLVQGRTGNAAPFTAPRNMYVSSDGKWLALSASAQSIAERVMRIVGREDLVDEPWFADHMGRLDHADELDAIIQAWIGGRTAEEVCRVFAENDAAIAPAYSIAEIFDDPHYAARETLTTVPHPVLGPITMQNMIAKLMETPGSITSVGGTIGQDTASVLREQLGLSAEEVAMLEERGVVSTGAEPAPAPAV
jgi:crotonobetainyl-CoA:carnitine CoA-transferase CaiB-like acyl-CoA transferase